MGNAVSDGDCVDRTPGDESATLESTSVERATYAIVTPDTRSQSISRSAVTDERMVDLVTDTLKNLVYSVSLHLLS